VRWANMGAEGGVVARRWRNTLSRGHVQAIEHALNICTLQHGKFTDEIWALTSCTSDFHHITKRPLLLAVYVTMFGHPSRCVLFTATASSH
jgi:ubiquinone biosynthesis protein COQ9